MFHWQIIYTRLQSNSTTKAKRDQGSQEVLSYSLSILIRGTGHHRNWTSVGFYAAAFACAPHGPNYGKVALVRMFPMMSVGCMQSLVRQRHRRAEVMACDFGLRDLKPVT